MRDEATNDQGPLPAVRFVAEAGGQPDASPQTEAASPLLRHQKRAYRRAETALPRWWRTRLDPFAMVWAELEQWLEAAPTRTAKSLFAELQQRYPNQYAPMQLRTLQRRIAQWRTTMITTFDDHWLHDEVLAPANVPRPLGVARTVAPDGEERCAESDAPGWSTPREQRRVPQRPRAREACWVTC